MAEASDPAAGGTCPPSTRTRRQSISAPRCTWRRSIRSVIREPVRTFGTFTSELHRLAEWFAACGVKTSRWSRPGSTGSRPSRSSSSAGSRWCWSMPATPSTSRGAKPTSATPSGCGAARIWSAPGQLPAQGEIAALRAYLRQRERLLDYAASHIQHMQKALTQMNLQLHHVVSDITGATGMRIIRAIVAGERDPDALASYRDRRCHASVETIRAALIGNDREEHVFALAQALDLYDVYQDKMAECDARIEAGPGAADGPAAQPAGQLPQAAVQHKAAQRPGVRCPGRAACASWAST